jgi:hypothetical protein
MRVPAIATACLLSVFVLSSPALAQQRSVVNPADMRQAVVDQAQAHEQTRSALRTVVANPQVRAVAARLGLDVTRADGAIATMTPAELERAATPVRDLNERLAGGANTVIISTTTLLLILIIVILVT